MKEFNQRKREKSEVNLKGESGRKWSKIRKNIIAFARMKIMNDDLRLWGSNINVVGLNPKDFEHVKKLMAEN